MIRVFGSRVRPKKSRSCLRINFDSVSIGSGVRFLGASFAELRSTLFLSAGFLTFIRDLFPEDYCAKIFRGPGIIFS